MIRAGIIDTHGSFKGVPSTLDVAADASVYYEVPASAFRITAEPTNKMMKAGNWVQQKDMVKADIDVYVIAVVSDQNHGVEQR